MHGDQHSSLSLLRSLLERFREFDLGRPAMMSVDEYLEFLSAEHVLSESTARATRQIYHQARYGSADAPQGEIEQLARDLEAAVDAVARRDEPARRQLAERLRGGLGTPAPPALPQANGKPHSVAAHPAYRDDESPWTDATDFSSASPPPQRVWLLAAIGGVVWTIAITAATHWNHNRIEDVLESARRRFGADVSPEDSERQIRNLRELLADTAAGPARRQLLNNLGTLHAQRGEDAQAVVAYYQALSVNRDPLSVLDPDRAQADFHFDPEVLNNLAWLLLTTNDPACHDPRQALPLARRAFAMHPSAVIADTLAEAYYQNGQYARAVGLERRAIAMHPANVEFYHQQLEKFEAARDAAAQTASVRP